MSSSGEAKTQAARRKRLLIFGATLLVAAITFAAIALATGGDDESKTERVTLFDGIPQQGAWLGREDAPVVVAESADMQCPFCAAFSKDQLPAIVRDYVRSGEVRMRLRLLTFIGEDSVKAARVGAAAAAQNKLWPFAEAFYADQGPENSGYATDDFLRDQLSRAGADVDKAMADRADGAATRAIAEDRDAATAANVDSTPTFVVTPRDGKPQTVGPDGLAAALEAATT